MPIEFANFAELAKQPHMMEEFRKHLAKEHSTENLDFHLAVGIFKAQASNPSVSDQELRESAREIFATYVDDSQPISFSINAPPQNRQVNLSSDVYEPIETQMKNLETIDREEISNMFDEANEKTVALMQTDSMRRSQVAMNASIKPAEDRIKQLEARAEQLQTSRWERFKAAFNGGAKKEIESIVEQIDKAKMEILQKTDPQRLEVIQREKEKMAEKLGAKMDKLKPNELEFAKVKNAVTNLALEDNFGGSMSQQQRAELENLAQKAPGMVAAQKASESIGKEKEQLTKSVTVGEALKGKVGNAPTQGQRGLRV